MHLHDLVHLASVQGFPRLDGWANACYFAKFYTCVCDNNFPSLVASLFSWRCLAASTYYFLHTAMSIRPLSVTVSTHTSAFNVVAFQSPLCQTPGDVALYAIGSLFFLPIPSTPQCTLKVSEHDSLSRVQHCLNALAPSSSKGTVI